MALATVGRWLIGFGLALAAVGLVLWIAGRAGLGGLPGDFVLTRGRTTVYFPLATSLIISVILSIVLTLVARLRR